MSMHQSSADPSRIMNLSTAFWDAQTLLTANRLGIFDTLADEPLNADQLATRLELNERALTLLLNTLCALGLLQRQDDRYANSDESAAFLVAGKPGYLGNAIRYSDNLYETWGRLENAVREGQPQLETAAYTGQSEQMTRDFVYGMHDRALGIGRMLVEMIDLTGAEQLLDIGGGPGTYSALIAQRYPALQATVLELPGVAAHAETILKDMGVQERVSLISGDFRHTPFPEDNDAVLISGVLHRESSEGCRELINKAAIALRPGGQLIVSDVFTDEGGCAPAFATLFGLNMLLTAPDGGVHADAEVAEWMRDAGFSVSATLPFPPPMPHRVVCGTLND